ncbi:prostaglandin reductase 1-like [Prorops nasuta]|uniref:prostaglandin reductase 1-like n=1 Tax=Prorops nasuta TaxID=863751 RepID=UPI0034CD33DA
MVKAKRFVIVQHFEKEPKPSDLKLVEEELPPINDGEYLVEAEYLSVDPYMRVYTTTLPLGSTMIGGQVGKILESKNPDYPVGKKVMGYFGWRTHTVVSPNGVELNLLKQKPYILPDIGNLSSSLCLGVLGMPGNTAYFGFLEICQPKVGETLVVSGAAGAVGSHVGQIAKHVLDMTVIGIAGSDEKCKYLVQELGFDAAINYKTENIAKALREAAPQGVDCYFDNVGGEISSTVIYQMNNFGRISVCGSISSYNENFSSLPKASILQIAVVSKQLKMEGFIVNRWQNRWMEGINKNLQWIKDGKLKYKETTTNGFENTYKAFMDMMHGENTGKAIVKV